MHRCHTPPASSPPAPVSQDRPTGVPGRACVREAVWPLERVLFALAGTLTAASAALAAFLSPWFLLLTAFIAVNQLAYASVGVCGASFLLSRVVGLRSSIYTSNRQGTR